MSVQVIDGNAAANWAQPLSRWLQGRLRRRGVRLDVAGLSDHLRRDLGLLGGRDAPPRDILRD